MDKFIISGGNKITGRITVSGAKNVAMKAVLAAILTDGKVTLHNVPVISSVVNSIKIITLLGLKARILKKHTVEITGSGISDYIIPLDLGASSRAATMAIGPLLARFGKAVVPNPGGCRIGKRSIERHIEGLVALGAKIQYRNGFFHAKANCLKGADYTFPSNTHTGTETLILAAVLARGETMLHNAAREPEVDDLINLLNRMGADIVRVAERTIRVRGVKRLHSAEYAIMPDRNEVVTFAIGAIASNGDVSVRGTQRKHLSEFLEKLSECGAHWEETAEDEIRFKGGRRLKPTQVTTRPYPGFMTDWQAPWAVLMTQAYGTSMIHETIYEDRFGYVGELGKMGADITMYNPPVPHPDRFYNFNWSDRNEGTYHAVKISGPAKLHNAILDVSDLRAGATLVLAACISEGESVINGIEHIDRGYEDLDKRLKSLNVHIKRISE